MITKLLERFEVNYLLSTPYHLQTNGLVERFNRTLCKTLAKLSVETKDWNLFIAPALFAYWTTKHATTKIEPFFMVYERAAWLPIDFPEDSSMTNKNDRLFALINQLPHIRKKARTTVTRSQTKQKDQHDRKVRTPIKFQIGDKVLYFKVTLDQSHLSKFDQK